MTHDFGLRNERNSIYWRWAAHTMVENSSIQTTLMLKTNENPNCMLNSGIIFTLRYASKTTFCQNFCRCQVKPISLPNSTSLSRSSHNYRKHPLTSLHSSPLQNMASNLNHILWKMTELHSNSQLTHVALFKTVDSVALFKNVDRLEGRPSKTAKERRYKFRIRCFPSTSLV